LRGFLFFENCQKTPKNSLFRCVIRAGKRIFKSARLNFSETLTQRGVQNLNMYQKLSVINEAIPV